MGVLSLVIHASDQGVFDGNNAFFVTLSVDIVARALQQYGDRVFTINRHQFIAQRIVGSVQRYGQ